MFVVPISSSKEKKLICKAKYPTEKQARYARFALIKIANCVHAAPVDSEIDESGAKLVPNPKWSIGEIVEEKDKQS